MAKAYTCRRVTIAVAPNGGRRTRQDHPAIPLTAAELARTSAECLEAGASMIHVHVRKPDGTHLLSADAYRDVIAAIQGKVGDRMVVQITTESLGVYSPAEQIAVLKAVRPEAASLALRELAPDEAAEPEFFRALEWMKRERVAPQVILYEPAEALRLAGMAQRGNLPWPDVPVLYVLGRYTASQTSLPADVLPFLAPGNPRFGNWSLCAFGRHEAKCVVAAALLGGHIRLGFENNMLLPHGGIAGNNAELVSTAACALQALGMELADADEARAWFCSEAAALARDSAQ